MKKKRSIIACIVISVLIFLTVGTNFLITNLIENINTVCKDQKFNSAEEALQAMELYERENYDNSLNYCPPYELVYSFDYDKNTIVFYSYCNDFDGEKSKHYAVRILKHNKDNTLSFSGAFAKFLMNEPNGNEDYCYCTNIKTSRGYKSISFLYLPINSDKNIYVDGKKAEKIPVTINDEDFYICYAISGCDTFLSDLLTSTDKRHKIEVI
ncbi:MAG: hypothetical protein IKY78_01360 [Clostridia bacterium]|nr:hypothetical protein [Clostridia bacterium]